MARTWAMALFAFMAQRGLENRRLHVWTSQQTVVVHGDKRLWGGTDRNTLGDCGSLLGRRRDPVHMSLWRGPLMPLEVLSLSLAIGIRPAIYGTRFLKCAYSLGRLRLRHPLRHSLRFPHCHRT